MLRLVTADKETAETTEEIKLNYTSRDGEGKVSRGLVVNDPNMLMIPAEVTLDGANNTSMAYSYALWVKVDNYAHDKQGTNLIQRTLSRTSGRTTTGVTSGCRYVRKLRLVTANVVKTTQLTRCRLIPSVGRVTTVQENR